MGVKTVNTKAMKNMNRNMAKKDTRSMGNGSMPRRMMNSNSGVKTVQHVNQLTKNINTSAKGK